MRRPPTSLLAAALAGGLLAAGTALGQPVAEPQQEPAAAAPDEGVAASEDETAAEPETGGEQEPAREPAEPSPAPDAAAGAVTQAPSPASAPDVGLDFGASTGTGTAAPGDASEPGTYEARAVVSVTPVLGVGVERDRLPSNVQLLGGDGTATGATPGVGRALQRRIGGVVVNDVQANPMQIDVSFRGFSASPLLGTPQGLAVYQNGTRVNEPFGDVVQWELIPDFAIEQMQLIPGANPVYGLNTLGGSIALRMKSGFTHRGLAASARAGSFGRRRATLEYGAVHGDWALYEGIDAFAEDGFRDHSDSSTYRLYGDVRNAADGRLVAANLTLAGTDLRGNGPAPLELLERDRNQVFTWPDITDNNLIMLAVQTDLALTDALSLQSNVYVRALGRDTLNGDEAELAPCPGDPALLCEDDDDGGDADDGEPVLDEDGATIPASAGGSGALNTTRTFSVGYGASIQTALARPIDGHDNSLILGTSVDAAEVEFTQRAQVGRLEADREITGGGFFLGDDAFRTGLDTRNLAFGLYATDTFSVTPRLHATVAARLNLVRIELEDRLGSALDGEHDFARLNPSAGLAYQLPLGVTVYAGYSESNRVPSAAELGCADPEEPCRVPNAFLADPPLAQVVNRSVEAGVRGAHRIARTRLSWSLTGFASFNQDDILFVAGNLIGTGYFRNAGQTRRLGGEAGLRLEHDLFELFAAHQLLLATFQDRLVLPGDNHPGARMQDGRPVIDVEPGDRLPGLPVYTVKAGARVTPLAGLGLGLAARVSGGQPLRGDEANLLDPVGSHVVLDADARYALLEWLTLLVEVENLLDTEYETFGLLGDAREVLDFATDPRFFGAGAPLGVWAGIELRLE